jgi:hypothetical protein
MSRIFYATITFPIRCNDEDEAFTKAHDIASNLINDNFNEQEFPVKLFAEVSKIEEDEIASKIVEEWE